MRRNLSPRATLLLASLTVSLLPIAAPTATAEATDTLASCTGADHCYGIIQWVHGNVGGAEVELGTYKLKPTDTENSFATSEFWIGFDPPASRPDDTLWLEFGVIHGVWCNGNMSWFSAIQRSVVPDDFVLQCHGAAAESNTKHILKADEPFDGTWNLYRNGSQVTGYGSAPTGTRRLSVGTEITAESVQSSMTGGKLRFKYQATGNWANGWASSGYPAGSDAPLNWPCYSSWVSKPNDMRARCYIDSIAATTIETYPTIKAAPPAEEMKHVAALLQTPGVAASAAQIQSVESNSKVALSALDISSPDERPVVVMQLEGQFQGDKLPVPPKADTPKGNSLTVVFDSVTGEMLALHLSGEKKLDLSTLGQVSALS